MRRLGRSLSVSMCPRSQITDPYTVLDHWDRRANAIGQRKWTLDDQVFVVSAAELMIASL
jgi:hypothetical protein